VSGNRLSDNILAKIERHKTIPFITVSGNASARQTLDADGVPGTGSPEGIVEAPPSSMFVPRQDIAGGSVPQPNGLYRHGVDEGSPPKARSSRPRRTTPSATCVRVDQRPASDPMLGAEGESIFWPWSMRSMAFVQQAWLWYRQFCC
jgi:hypothetical protein